MFIYTFFNPIVYKDTSVNRYQPNDLVGSRISFVFVNTTTMFTMTLTYIIFILQRYVYTKSAILQKVSTFPT